MGRTLLQTRRRTHPHHRTHPQQHQNPTTPTHHHHPHRQRTRTTRRSLLRTHTNHPIRMASHHRRRRIHHLQRPPHHPPKHQSRRTSHQLARIRIIRPHRTNLPHPRQLHLQNSNKPHHKHTRQINRTPSSNTSPRTKPTLLRHQNSQRTRPTSHKPLLTIHRHQNQNQPLLHTIPTRLGSQNDKRPSRPTRQKTTIQNMVRLHRNRKRLHSLRPTPHLHLRNIRVTPRPTNHLIRSIHNPLTSSLSISNSLRQNMLHTPIPLTLINRQQPL